jgi:hypothetical protein
MKQKLLILVIILLQILFCNAQFSKTHYIPPLSSSTTMFPGEQYMYISTPSELPVNFKIIELGGNVIAGTVSKSTPYVYTIGTGSTTQLHVQAVMSSMVYNNKGYIIEAEDLVYVSIRLIDSTTNHAGKVKPL